jgi:flavin reductase (DIM6/NTAB) family NADH-FMN oxidoreductase RutF
MEHIPADYQRTLPEPALLRSTFAGFPSGVAAVAATVDGADEVLIASSFTVGVSLDPPLVMFAVQNSSKSWPRLKSAPVLGVSVLGADQDQACRQLASGPPEQRFAGIDVHRASTEGLFVRHAPVWLECEIWDETPAGDHTVVILKIRALFRDDTIEPLVFHGSTFRRLEPFAQ